MAIFPDFAKILRCLSEEITRTLLIEPSSSKKLVGNVQARQSGFMILGVDH